MCRMLGLCCYFTVIFLVLKAGAEPNHVANHEGHVNSLLESLESEEWADDEQLCKKAIFSLLNGVKNHTTWATWIWDSMQLPVAILYGSRYHLGSFDQCLKDPWSQQPTQYCLVDVTLTEETSSYEEVDPHGNVEDFVGIETKYGRRHLNHYFLGVCLPSVCSPSSVATISRYMHKLSHLPFGKVSVEPSNCQTKKKLEYSVGFYGFWCIIILTTGIATTSYFVEDYIVNVNLSKIAIWFSPSRNFKALTTTNRDEITTFTGIRAFCAGTAVVMHYFYYGTLFSFNMDDVGKDMSTVIGRTLVQFSLFIDSFFVMSGLLHMKGHMASSSNPMKILLKRYLRLLAPFALSLLYMSAVLPHTASGPLWPRLVKEQSDICARNWWLGPLMINNFVRTEEICHVVTWYIACDYQLSILGTAIFCLCRKWSRRTVVAFCLVSYLVSMAVPAALGYWYQLPAILIYDIEQAAEVGANKVFQTAYIKPYSRAGAYLIGLFLGYIMHVYSPKDNRKAIPKKWSILGGTVGFLIIFWVMGLGGTINHNPYNVLHTSAYMAVERNIFALGLCLVAIACEYGTFREYYKVVALTAIIGDFLSSKVLVPLSRLSYGALMYHPALLYMNLYSTRSPYTYDFFQSLLHGFGYVIVAFMISYLLWFIVEAPTMNMITSLFQNRKIATSENRIQNSVDRKSEKQL